MSFFKQLILLTNNRDNNGYDATAECANATAKIVSILPLVEEHTFNACFEEALKIYCNGDFKNINTDTVDKFIEIFKDVVESNEISFQVKDGEETDYVIDNETGEIKEVKVSRHLILKEMFVRSLNAPDFCTGIEYYERLLRTVKRKAIKDATVI